MTLRGAIAAAVTPLRDGGSSLEDGDITVLLEKAGWSDVRVLNAPTPTLTFIAGRKD